MSADLEQRIAALEADVRRLLLHLGPEPDFLQDCAVALVYGDQRMMRLTHRPTGIRVDAPTQPEAVALLAAELEKLEADCRDDL